MSSVLETVLGSSHALYMQLLQEEQETAVYDYFKKIIQQTTALQSSAKRTHHAIVANTKSVIYWEQINVRIHDDIKELKVLTTAHNEKVAEIELLEKQDLELKAIVDKTLDNAGDGDCDKLNEDVVQKKAELDKLKARESELNEAVKMKKTTLDYFCKLVKRLNDSDPELLQEVIDEIDEKRVLTDISMDLD